MAAILSHAVAGAAIAAALRPHPRPPARYWLYAVFCAVVPDIDVLLVWLGTDYRGMFGHRGITHSIAFAALLAALCALEMSGGSSAQRRSLRLWGALFACGLSHALLDGMMSGGKGVAFFAPFTAKRLHLPIRPIDASPPGRSMLLREGGVKVSASEILWIWVPFLLLAAVALWADRRRAARPAPLSSLHD
jgi:inner membrane protein